MTNTKLELVQWILVCRSCAIGWCFKVCKQSKPAGCQRCAAVSIWRAGGFSSGVSRLLKQHHERDLCFHPLPPKSWNHTVTVEQTPQCHERWGTTQAWDEVGGSWLAKNHHTNPRGNYISSETTHKTLDIIQTVHSYFNKREKLLQKSSYVFLETEAGGWPLIICNELQ